MTATDHKEYWLLKNGERAIIIVRRPDHHGLNVLQWVETKRGEQQRSGACDIGPFANTKPATELAKLLERFRGEGYELISVRTYLTPAVLRLLRDLDRLDTGDGVKSTIIRNGWQVEGGGRYSHHTFRELDGIGVIDVGNGFGDPAKILPVGRDLARLTQRRRATAASRED